MSVLWSFTSAAVILSLLQEKNFQIVYHTGENVGQKQLNIFHGLWKLDKS